MATKMIARATNWTLRLCLRIHNQQLWKGLLWAKEIGRCSNTALRSSRSHAMLL